MLDGLYTGNIFCEKYLSNNTEEKYKKRSTVTGSLEQNLQVKIPPFEFRILINIVCCIVEALWDLINHSSDD